MTRWPQYLLNFWPFTTMKITPITKQFAQVVSNFWPKTKNRQRLLKWCQSGEISPNVVPLHTPTFSLSLSLSLSLLSLLSLHFSYFQKKTFITFTLISIFALTFRLGTAQTAFCKLYSFRFNSCFKCRLLVQVYETGVAVQLLLILQLFIN